ncbi:MAG TPA: M20/M25/M40 family metallo-hydrolase [Bdellovibrionales bacterium]|nr:M20/M25/M40 family metallo-hydrolase [Bdellovibrionales bacterium]
MNNDSQERAERLLHEIVDIDSLTSDPVGVDRVQEIVARELQSLGFDVRMVPNPDSSITSGQLLIATLNGDRPDFITFVSHADCVLGIEAVGPYRKLADGVHGRGPGVIDNKGGLVVAIEGLRLYLEELQRKERHSDLSLRFVCSPNEEGGSTGFHQIFRTCADDSVLVLGFEPALDNGSIVESRRGNRWYQLTIEGQEAHAGRCKGEQINAAHDFAIKAAKLHKLNDPKNGIAVNVGHVEGGRNRFNVVCGNISAKIDTRFASFESRDKLHRKIEKILLKPAVHSPITGRSSESSFTIVDDCPPFSSTAASRTLLKYYLRTIEKLEKRSIAAEKAGGAGDVNYMSRKDVIVLDGLGPIGGSMHTPEEFIYLPSLSSRAAALGFFLEKACSELD